MTSIVGTGLDSYIKRNARERALNRLAEAEIEARQIIAGAERRAAQVREQASALAAEAATATQQRTLAQANLNAQAEQVRRREVVLQSVWLQARERLEALSAHERLEALAALAQDAADQLGGGDLALQVNAADAFLLTETVLAPLRDAWKQMGVSSVSLAVEPARIIGGVIVWRTDRLPGAQRLVDNSWDERLRLSYQVLREQIYGQLHQLGEAVEPERGARL